MANNELTTAQKIRKALKDVLGLTSRQVSVRADGSSARVTVKDLSVDFQHVRQIAESYKRVRRCQMTREILSGGNTFVSVSYCWNRMREASKTFGPQFRPFLEEAKAKPGCCISVGQGFSVSGDLINPHLMSVWQDNSDGTSNHVTQISAQPEALFEALITNGFRIEKVAAN